MGRLVAHLARQAAQFADVVEHHDGAGDTVAGPLDRRCRDLDRMLLLALAAHHQRPPAHVDAPSHGETALHRVTERTPVRLVDERKDVADLLPCGRFAVGTRHALGGAVHVVDTALVVGRNDSLGDRFQRVLRLALAAAQRHLEALAVADIARDRQDGIVAAVLDDRALGLDPEPLVVAVDELDLQPLGHALAGKATGHGLAEQGAVGGLDEIGGLPALELLRAQADEPGGAVIGQQDALVVDQHDFGDRAGKFGEQAIAILDLLVALRKGVEQPVDRLPDVTEGALAANVETAPDVGIGGGLDQFLVELAELPLQAPAAQESDGGERQRNEQRQGQRDDEVIHRHAGSTASRVVSLTLLRNRCRLFGSQRNLWPFPLRLGSRRGRRDLLICYYRSPGAPGARGRWSSYVRVRICEICR